MACEAVKWTLAGMDVRLRLKNGRVVTVTVSERNSGPNHDSVLPDRCELDQTMVDGAAYLGPCARCGLRISALYISESG